MAKFTKESVVEKIKNILKTTGGGQEVSDRTINDTLENLMVFANEEIELDAFVAQIQGGLISINGNMRKEKADAAKAIADSESEKARLAKIESDKKKAEEDAKKTPPIEEPEWAKKIREKLEAQELKESEVQKKVANDAKIAGAKKLLESAGANNKKVLEVALGKIKVTDEMTEEQIKTTVLPLYNTEYKEFYGDGSIPVISAISSSPEAMKEAQSSAIKKVKDLVKKSGVNVPEEQ